METNATVQHSLGAQEAAKRLQQFDDFTLVSSVNESIGRIEGRNAKIRTTITDTQVSTIVTVDSPWWWSWFPKYVQRRTQESLEKALKGG